MVSRQRGFTLIEIVVTLAIIGILILIFAVSQREALTWDRTNRIDYFRLPDQSAVLTRLRRDILDTVEYSQPFAGYRQTDRTLLLIHFDRDQKERHVIVYDFSTSKKARRIEYLEKDSGAPISDWTANETPDYTVNLYNAGTAAPGVRILGRGDGGLLVVDQIMVPRA